ncbi:MAG: hypothetical protein JSU64_02465 [candidate division WOR-3 bacterium]|nr:MAG: hypothetical protein JSU64_02465 [candidate division WOR-3 bacterium]
MDVLDNISGIIGYVTVRPDDGSVEEIKGASATAIADLTAYFSSAGEAIRSNLDMGTFGYVSLVYGNNRLVIVPFRDRYVGIETERTHDPQVLIKHLNEPVAVKKTPVEVSRSLASKVHQINLLVDEFGGNTDRAHWLGLLTQSLSLLGREIAPYIGVVDDKLAFKESPTTEREDDHIQALRYVVDFLVKKAVEEMGSSQARAKVQVVIERMK